MRAVFITEGKKNIGFGHITRCLGISQAFKERKIKTFFIVNGDESVLKLLQTEKSQLFDWIKYPNQLNNLIKEDDILLIDSYLADKNFYTKISKFSDNVIYIDDNNRLPYPKGTVLNGNIYSKESDYPVNKNIRYLVGAKYAPLREEFWTNKKKVINKNIKNILITFGGDDLRNLTEKILVELQIHYPNAKKIVVIGAGFKDIEAVKRSSDWKTELIFNANSHKLKELMTRADIAVSASGQTTLELLRTGLPSILVRVTDNQASISEYMSKKKLAELAGNWQDKYLIKYIIDRVKKLESYKIRKNISERQQTHIDGQGPRRIVNEILGRLPKKILFLTNNNESVSLANWLKFVQKEQVIVYDKKLTEQIIFKLKPEFLISYNYKYIIPVNILKLFLKGTAINLHISYLPWNRGSNPNFWSHIEDTPKGVTIHVIDKNIDTGDILVQEKINFKGKNPSLSSTYLELNNKIKNLFKRNWFKLKNLKIKPKKQLAGGSTHTMKEFDKIRHLINKDKWDTPIELLDNKNKNEINKNQKLYHK